MDTTELLFNIRALVAGEAPPVPLAAAVPVAQAAAPAAAAPAAAPAQQARQLELRVGPLEQPEQADNLIDLFKEITDLGTIEPIDGGLVQRRHASLQDHHHQQRDSDLLDLFTFHVTREAVAPLPAGPGLRLSPPLAPGRRPGRRGRPRLRLLRRRAGRPGLGRRKRRRSARTVGHPGGHGQAGDPPCRQGREAGGRDGRPPTSAPPP